MLFSFRYEQVAKISLQPSGQQEPRKRLCENPVPYSSEPKILKEEPPFTMVEEGAAIPRQVGGVPQPEPPSEDSSIETES